MEAIADDVDLLLQIKQDDRLWPDLGQLHCSYEASLSTVWSFMEFRDRPSYNPDLLADFHGWQHHLARMKATHGDALKYVVLASRHKGAFCFGGDLDYFSMCIETRNRQALYEYGRSCIEILHRNWLANDCELTTIALVEADALGGGFESLLSFDVIVAEEGAKFGFPEQLFGLFPGMGALTFLGRKLGAAKAEWLVRTGMLLTAEQMFDLGVVHVLAKPGEGMAEVRRYIAKNGSRHAAHHRRHLAAKRANPIPFEELDAIVELWSDACMSLETSQLQVMKRLVRAQSRMSLVE